MHSGRFEIQAGKPLPPGLQQEDLEALAAGVENLEKQIENVRLFGIPVVVAINRFPTDTEAEIALVQQAAVSAGAAAAHVSTLFSDGGKGGEELAHALVKACDEPSSFRFLYPESASLKEKIETLATKVYGADGVDYDEPADRQLARFEERGYGRFPICMAKTQYSLSHDPKLKGAPAGYRFKVRDARVAVGAGFVYPLAGAIMTMPGLGKEPGGAHIDIDAAGNVVGMF
jgi:formate--tetrahydrofolate ligase